MLLGSENSPYAFTNRGYYEQYELENNVIY